MGGAYDLPVEIELGQEMPLQQIVQIEYFVTSRVSRMSHMSRHVRHICHV